MSGVLQSPVIQTEETQKGEGTGAICNDLEIFCFHRFFFILIDCFPIFVDLEVLQQRLKRIQTTYDAPFLPGTHAVTLFCAGFALVAC